MTAIEFECNGVPVAVAVDAGTSLLTMLREHLGAMSAKDGCAPQGQCGCCTVLIDGEPRVACVTPAARVEGRAVTTLEGLDPAARERLGAALFATGGAQCGFCTPGIVVRCAALLQKEKSGRTDLDRALAAHLCRCTGWQTIYEAILGLAGEHVEPVDRPGAEARATLEGGVGQRVGAMVALGGVEFADDGAPRDALVAVPLPPGSTAASVTAAGLEFVVAASLHEARLAAGKVQGRRTTVAARPPLAIPPPPPNGVSLATSWVEPAYLEPDASWCRPGGAPTSPLANGGAFGGKEDSPAPRAARELADHFDRPVRVVFAREDVVRLCPKRPPLAATAVLDGDTVRIEAQAAALVAVASAAHYGLEVDARVAAVAVAGPPVGRMRAPWAETAVLIEGALAAAGFDRATHLDRAANPAGKARAVLLDVCVASPEGAFAGASVTLDGDGRPTAVRVAVAAGDPLDTVVLRSYCIGATHMALGWVRSEGLAVDPVSGEVHDLTIRSFGIVRPADMPEVIVDLVDDPRPPVARSSDAVFAAVAAATWIALGMPDRWPAGGKIRA